VNFAGVNREIHAVQDLLAFVGLDLEGFNLEERGCHTIECIGGSIELALS
jgi:hypothetical protein